MGCLPTSRSKALLQETSRTSPLPTVHQILTVGGLMTSAIRPSSRVSHRISLTSLNRCPWDMVSTMAQIALTMRFMNFCLNRSRKPVSIATALCYCSRAEVIILAMFYIGSNVQNHPLEAQRALADGHEICVREYYSFIYFDHLTNLL